MNESRISREQFERIYISNIPIGDSGKEYIHSLFEKVYSLSEAVVVWLWSPDGNVDIFFSQVEALKNKLNYFRTVEAKRSSFPIQFMFSYKFDSEKIIEKDKLIDLLVAAWFGYERPEIYFLVSNKYFEVKADIIMNRESRNLSINQSISIMPDIYFYRDSFEEEAWMKNDSGLPIKTVFPDIED